MYIIIGDEHQFIGHSLIPLDPLCYISRNGLIDFNFSSLLLQHFSNLIEMQGSAALPILPSFKY